MAAGAGLGVLRFWISLTGCAGTRIGITGPRVGVIQHVQVGRHPDGPQHGLRARSEGHQGQHPQPGPHLHKVSTIHSSRARCRRVAVCAANCSPVARASAMPVYGSTTAVVRPAGHLVSPGVQRRREARGEGASRAHLCPRLMPMSN